MIEELVKSLGPAGAMALIILALWKKMHQQEESCRQDRTKMEEHHRQERLAADQRERELIKELATLSQRLLLAHEKLKLESEKRSSPPRT